MSLFVSSFLPNGNYLIAADTRVCGHSKGGVFCPQRDDFHKITQLNSRTFIFTSGYAEPCSIVAQGYKRRFRAEYAKDLLIKLARACRSAINKTELEEAERAGGQAMVFVLVQAEGERMILGMYMGSMDFEPWEYEDKPEFGSVYMFGAYIPGTDEACKAMIRAAKTYNEAIQAFRDVFNAQSRAEVGGDVEMFEISPTTGFVKQMKFKIREAN